MKNMGILTVSIVLIIGVGFPVQTRAQTPSSTRSMKAKFKLAQQFIWDSLLQKTYRLSVNPHWFADSTGFVY